MKEFFEKAILLDDAISVGFVRPGTGTPVHRNRQSYGLVYYPAASSVFSFVDGRTIPTKKGSIIFLPRGSNYEVLKGEETEQGCWCINFSTLRPITSEPFLITFKAYDKVGSLFAAAEKTYHRTAYDSKLRSIFYEILSLMEIEYNQKYVPSSVAKRLIPAMDYIRQNCFYRSVDIDELSALCRVSSTYFRRLFAKVYGTSPVKYINSLRVKRAKELIDSGMYATMTEIALQCGFSDDCYFRKVFKSETLMTPGEYMRNKKTPFG